MYARRVLGHQQLACGTRPTQARPAQATTSSGQGLLEQVLVGNNGFEGLEAERDFPGIGERVLFVSGRQIDGFPLIVLTVDDLTENQ